MLHSELDTGIDRAFPLIAKTAVFVIFAPEGDNHPQHGYRLVDDRQRFPLHAFDGHQALLDVPEVVANRAVKERHHRQREQGQLRVNQKRDPEHAQECQQALDQGRNGHDQPGRGIRLKIDGVNQLAGPALVMKSHRQALGMLEKVAPKIQDHILVDLGVHIIVQNTQPLTEQRKQQAGGHAQDQQQRTVRRHRTEQPGQGGRERLALEHIVHQEFQGPGQEQARQAAEDHESDREAGQLPMRLQVPKGSRQIVHGLILNSAS